MRRFQGVAASIFACACASGCGKTHTLADAPTGDSNTTDANTTPDAALAVTVTTYSRNDGTAPNHTLVANVPVYVVGPTGTFGQTGMTNAQGTISFQGVEPGSSITAVYSNANGYKIVTTLGVKPGDNLVYGDVYQDQHGSITQDTMTLTFPPVTNATQYEVRHPCQYDYPSGSPATLTIGCDATSGDMFLVASDVNGIALATGLMHGAAYGPGKTAALAAWTNVTTPDVTASVSGLSAEVGSLGVHVGGIVDGIPYQQVGATFISPSGGGGSGTVAAPPGGDRLFAFEELNNTGAFGHKESFQKLASDVRAVAFTEPGLPWMGPLTWDYANQQVSWTTEGTGGYDAMILEALWSTDTGTVVYYDWDIIAPSGLSSFSWAGLPSQLAPYVPATADQPYTNYTALIDLSNASSYDELRQQPEWFLSSTGFATEDGELPTGSNVSLVDGAEGYSPY